MKALNFSGWKGPAGAVDEARDAVFLGLGHMLGMAVELLEPERMFLRLLEIEAPGIEDLRHRHACVIGLDQLHIRVERDDDLPREFPLLRRRVGDLVEHDGIGEFDLIDEEIDQRPVVFVPRRLAAIPQEIARAVIAQGD